MESENKNETEMRVSDWRSRPGNPPTHRAKDSKEAPVPGNSLEKQSIQSGSEHQRKVETEILPAQPGSMVPARLVNDYFPRALSTTGSSSPSAAIPMASAYTVDVNQVQQLPIDIFRYIGGIWQRKLWIILGALTGLAGGFYFGYQRGDTYRASMILMFSDIPKNFSVEGSIKDGGTRSYKPREFDGQTLSAILTSDTLFQRMGPKLHPPMSAKELSKLLSYEQVRGADHIKLIYKGAFSAESAVAVVNTWGQEAVRFTKQLEAREQKLSRLYLQMESHQVALDSLKMELEVLRPLYPDENPLIREKLIQIESLTQKVKDYSIQLNESAETKAVSEDESTKDIIGYFNILSPATIQAVTVKTKEFKATAAGLGGFLAALFSSVCAALLMEILNRDLRTARELELAIGGANIQKIPTLSERTLDSSEISGLWTRIVGISLREIVSFWIPHPHEQPYLVMQGLLDMASKNAVPLLWVDTGNLHLRLPLDFQEIDLDGLNNPLHTGRYFLKLDLQSLSSVEAEHLGKKLVEITVHQKIMVWLGIEGPIVDPACALSRQSHYVKIFATLHARARPFWENQNELLKQSVTIHAQWLAVNHLPWYKW